MAHWHKGDYAKAEEYLRRAADAGNDTARANLAEYAKWEEDKD